MRIPRPLWPVLLCAGLTLHGSAPAQDFEGSQRSGFYMRLGAAARYNVKASITPIAPPTATGNYANGFVLPDIGGSTNLTWNWGYQSTNQVDAARGLLNFYRYDNVPTLQASDAAVNSPLWGGELIGGYRMADFKIARKPAHFGMELGFGYSGFSQNVNRSVAGTGSYTTAAYSYNGILLPAAPYAGTFAGPGPLLNLNPDVLATATDAPGGTVASVQGTLKSSFYELRFGPVLEWDLSRKFTASLGAGYSAIYVDAEWNYSQGVSFANPAIRPYGGISGKTFQSKWRPGVYAEMLVAYHISNRLNAYVGGDVHLNNSTTFGDSNYTVEINLDFTYQAKAGISYSF
jgi:hypothetical protein